MGIVKNSFLRPFDFVIFALVITTGIILTIKGTKNSGSVVQVNAAGVEYEFSSEKNGVYTVDGECGPTTFEIKNGKVHIIDSACPNKNCINQGWKTPLVCLPNNVIITLTEQGEFDGLSE